MTPESKAAVLAQTEANFRRLLAAGKPVAMEDARRGVNVPEGFDSRAFGPIAARMVRDGEIIEVGYRKGQSSRCNRGLKRLWMAAGARAMEPKKGVARG